MNPRSTGPLLVLFGLITAAGGWLMLFGGQSSEPPDSSLPDAPLLAAPTTTASPAPTFLAPPATRAPTAVTATTAPSSPYGARAGGGWALPALDGGPDIDSQQFGEETLVVVVSPDCTDCPATARAAVGAAAELGVGDAVILITFVDGVAADTLVGLTEEWAIPDARYARDVWLGDHWARSDILPDAVPIIGVWEGGAGHAGGW